MTPERTGVPSAHRPERTKRAPCICPHGEQSLGTLMGVRMGRGILRLSTTPGCPEHDACHGYTAEVRAARPAWSRPWCPIHGTRDCP